MSLKSDYFLPLPPHMKYYIIAGEVSGDIHSSNLIKAIRLQDKNAVFRFWGGDQMELATKKKAVKHISELAFMGFVEVLGNLRAILNNISFCKRDILDFKPDALILVDYPGFNLRIAKFAHLQAIKVFYYISPQIWAWKEKRIKIIQKYVDKMLVILPFEKAFYQKHNVDVHFVGHPLLDHIQNTKNSSSSIIIKGIEEIKKNNTKIIALLPGSRSQEVKRMLPNMVAIAKDNSFKDYHFVICGLNNFSLDFYLDIFDPHLNKKEINPEHGVYKVGSNISLAFDQTHIILQNAFAAVVTSGTATLETALFRVPEVVCYSANGISYEIAKRLIKLSYISLVNLIMEREVVKEIIQDEYNISNLTLEVKKLLNIEVRERILKDYDDLHSKLGGEGASQKAANIIVDEIS